MKILKWSAWLAGSSLCAMAAPVAAQSAINSSATEHRAAIPGTGAQSDDGNVTEILVTANRREERLQDVPLSVTVVDGGQLTRQNVTSVETLARTASALNTAGQPGSGAMSIRGIGGLSFSASSESSVGVVVDGVARSGSTPLMFDIARVEVLEGPQGMLFGRNASAGVLNITTASPDPSKVEAIFHSDIGSRDTYVAQGALNLPVSSNAALRVAGSFSQDPRVQRNLFDNSWLTRSAKAGRARFLWEPTDTLTVNLSADYNDTDTSGGVPWAVYASTPNSALTRRLAACGITVGPDNAEGCTDAPSPTSATAYGFSGQVDLDLGGATLTSITAYRASHTESQTDIDSTSANRAVQTVKTRGDSFSQEVRLASPSGGLIEYVAGLYFSKGDTRNRTGQLGQFLADLGAVGLCPSPIPGACSLPFGQFRRTNTWTKSYAVFGQATINATDRLSLILGARLGRDDVRAATTAAQLETGAVRILLPADAVNARVRDTYLSYRLGAQYDVSNDLMVFATYTRGYKGPAVNDSSVSSTQPQTVRPEIPKAGEIGFKATLAGGRAAFNATAFYTKVTDFQAQFWDPILAAFIFGNAPSLKSKGVTANLFGRPAKGVIANIGVTYNDAKYGPGYIVTNAANALVDADGKQLVGAAKWKVTASTEYSTSLSNDLDGFVQADMVYRTKGYSNASNDAILAGKAAAIFGGRIGLRTADGQLGASVFARNIFNTFRPAARFATPLAAQQLDPSSFSLFVGPEGFRVIGVSLDARF